MCSAANSLQTTRAHTRTRKLHTRTSAHSPPTKRGNAQDAGRERGQRASKARTHGEESDVWAYLRFWCAQMAPPWHSLHLPALRHVTRTACPAKPRLFQPGLTTLWRARRPTQPAVLRGRRARLWPHGPPARMRDAARAGRNLRGPEAIVLAPRLSLAVPALAPDAVVVADALATALAAVDLLPVMLALAVLLLPCRTMPSGPGRARCRVCERGAGALTSRLRMRMRFALLGSTRPLISLPPAGPGRLLCPGYLGGMVAHSRPRATPAGRVLRPPRRSRRLRAVQMIRSTNDPLGNGQRRFERLVQINFKSSSSRLFITHVRFRDFFLPVFFLCARLSEAGAGVGAGVGQALVFRFAKRNRCRRPFVGGPR